MSQRVNRLREMFKEEVSDIVGHALKDPRIGELTTVTDVELSGDLRHAKIYVSVYGDGKEQADTLQGLQSAAGFIRTELGKRIRLRYMPEIAFALDTSIAYGARISELLNQVRADNNTVSDGRNGNEEADRNHN